MTSSKSWCCKTCIQLSIPFSNCSDEVTKLTIQGKNIHNLPENLTLDTNKLQLMSEIDSIEIENPEDLKIADHKCSYLNLSDFNKLTPFNSSFSLFHLNIASLPLHFEELQFLLDNSNTKFDILVSKNKQNQHLTYLDIRHMTASQKGEKEALESMYLTNTASNPEETSGYTNHILLSLSLLRLYARKKKIL